MPRGGDQLANADWLTADREPFTLYATISKQNGVEAMWRPTPQRMLNGSADAASASSPSPSPLAAAAAAAMPVASASSSSSSDDSGNAQLVWQALHGLIRQAVPIVIRLQHERMQLAHRSALPPPPDYHLRACVHEARQQFPSSSLFHLISVPATVDALRAKGGCSYLVSGEVGCAEQPYLCLTCAEDPSMQDDSGCSWEMCQACAEKSSCHAGHSLWALVRTKAHWLGVTWVSSCSNLTFSSPVLSVFPLQPSCSRFVCHCGRRHAILLRAASTALTPQHHTPSLSFQAAANSAGAAETDDGRSAAAMTNGFERANDDDGHVCSGMLIQTSPSDCSWAMTAWPATIAQAERTKQAEEDKKRAEAMDSDSLLYG